MTMKNSTHCLTRWRVRGYWVLALAVFAVLAASPGHAQAKIPPHDCPWMESTHLDPQTLFLWKFSVGDDPAVEADDNKDEVIERSAQAPDLHGGAKVVAKVGRFGSGLALDGAGYAAAAVALGPILGSEKAFTLGGWIRSTAPTAQQTVLLMPGNAGKALLQLDWTPDANLALSVDGTERLRLPLLKTTGGWHFLALTMDGGAGNSSVSLLVDGKEARADAPAWLRGFAHRLGESFTLGGGPGVKGLQGVLDEVRLSSGIWYYYPWDMGWQELRDGRQEIGLQSPFFKHGTVLTRFHFDGNFTPEVCAGQAVAGKVNPSLFKPGLKGQALDLSQVEKAGFQINGYNILPEKEGTIEFWFRPLDWDNYFVGDFLGGDVKHYELMTLSTKAARGAMMKEVMLSRGRAGKDAAVHFVPFHPGSWTHVLISMQNGNQSVYLNGHPQKLGQLWVGAQWASLKKWREHPGGDDNASWSWSFVPSPTLINEFSVYSWGMTPEEAWNAYARWLPDAAEQMKPLPIFGIDFNYYAHCWDMQQHLVAKLTCLPVNDVQPASADMEVRSEQGEVLLSAEKQALDNTGTTSFTLKRALPFGRYPVIVRSRNAAGAVLKEEKREYVREKPAWFGNTLGKERTVPKPWTPVAVDGNTLKVIDRTISLGTNGLPAHIETVKQQVLAKPITIRAVSVAGAGTLEGTGVIFSETSPDRAAWKATLAGAGLTADLDAWIEFDGLLYYAVTLKPAGGADVTLNTLDIDVPFSATVGTQLLANGGGNDFRASWIAKMVPEGQGSVWNSLDKPYPWFTRAFGVTNFMPHIWVGNDDVGLYFGAENDRGWTVDGPHPAQEIVRRDGDVVFQMHIIREPAVISAAGQRFTFVLLPTPAKPEPPDWRKQMGVGGVNFGSCDSFGGFDMKTDPNNPGSNDSFLMEPHSWEHAAQMAPQSRQKWGRCILYTDASWPSPGLSFKDWQSDLWAGTGRPAFMPEFEDYAVWAINEYIKRGLIDGVYWDDVSVGYTLALDSTAYPYAKSESGRRVGFTALAQRRANMRLWRLFEAAGKEPGIWAHMTVCYEVPMFSFCRYMSNGEFSTGVEYLKTRDAMDFWNPQTIRVLGNSSKWGTGVSFLTTLPHSLPMSIGAQQWLYPEQRTEDALYMSTGIGTLSGGLVGKLQQNHFFDTQLRCFPCWKASDVLNIEAPPGAQILAAVYANDDRAYVMVTNHEHAVREVSVSLKLDKLFPGAHGVVWRDIDPGLIPPKKVMASDQELKELDPDDIKGDTKDLLKEAPLTEAEQLKALAIHINGDAVHMVVRERDYRLLVATPVK